jgi:SAM-dependent methyltransferase
MPAVRGNEPTVDTESVGSVYYQHSGALPLASRLSLRARTRMFQLFMDEFQPGPQTRILDVGVTSDNSFPESNFFEQLYPYPGSIVAVGTEDGAHLAQQYPGLEYRHVRSGEPLPFRDREFDIVFSNAVIEHVGGRAAQAAFLREIARVARAFFVTTPNRWFPVEHHTAVPLLHYLPPRLHRAVLARTKFHYWASEDTLNILSARTLAALCPPGWTTEIRRVRTLGVISNLVAVGRSG